MPNYEIKCWNEHTFDVDSIPWVKEAIERKKWSLASDYIRHYAVYTEGGIYLDTDVFVYKSFDDFLKYDFFTSVESHPISFESSGKFQVDGNGILLKSNQIVDGMGLLAATFGASRGNIFIKECMDYFGGRHFINEDGTLFENIINPGIMAMILYKYGFRYVDEEQRLNHNMIVFPSSIFAGDVMTKTEKSYSMHWCDCSWRTDKLNMINRVRLFLETHFPNIFRK
jgi:hypothetical protein